MARHSAGILPFVRDEGPEQIRVLLVHPGGPLWARKDLGAWSIPKGEFDPTTEDPRSAAKREFREELGLEPSVGDWIDLGEVRQPGGKRVAAWGVEGFVDTSAVASNRFEMEWPPRSGRVQSFPEVDRAHWFGVEEGRQHILVGQLPFIDRLLIALSPSGSVSPRPDHADPSLASPGDSA